MKKIILAGGTGNLGRLLTDRLIQNNWEVVILSRNIKRSTVSQITYVQWDGSTMGEWIQVLDGADAIINLSGKSIQCRFTPENKKELYASRLSPTKVIAQAIEAVVNKPRLWINFSGVSIFNKLIGIQDEDSEQVGKGFLAELSRDWEKAFFDSKVRHTQQVALRISPVLLKDSGFFAELLPLVKRGLGGNVSDGKQIMNWIHHEDLVRLVLWILERPSPAKVYHACTPNPLCNSEFMQVFRRVLGISIGLPLPTFMAKIGALFKGVDASLLLDSVPVTTIKTIEEGFVFYYPDAKTSIEQLVNHQPKL